MSAEVAAAAPKPAAVDVAVEFSGGLELLFDNKKTLSLSVPTEDGVLTLNQLIVYIRDNCLKERPELFVADDSVRPGVLVLVNDADWELEGKGAYEVQSGDEIAFISTLHGG